MEIYSIFGNPYEIYWTDIEDVRGFNIFDTETLEHVPVINPYRMFYQIYYNDNDHQTFDTRPYKDKIVKVVVRKKTSTKKFEKFIDKLYASNVAELKVVENFDFAGGLIKKIRLRLNLKILCLFLTNILMSLI